jgi:hypothetical protein
MRSLKEGFINIEGYKMIPGKLYILEFINRVCNREYIFEFDSVSKNGNSTTINHRGKWICENEVYVCHGVENLVTLPCGEDIKLSKYRKVIDWDNI